MRRMSLKRKLPVLLLVILVLGLSLHTGKSIQAALISKRRQAAETVIELFGKHLIQQLEAENFASKLMFALDTKEKANLTLFEEKAAKLKGTMPKSVFCPTLSRIPYRQFIRERNTNRQSA